jgi:hypothetical protein
LLSDSWVCEGIGVGVDARVFAWVAKFVAICRVVASAGGINIQILVFVAVPALFNGVAPLHHMCEAEEAEKTLVALPIT